MLYLRPGAWKEASYDNAGHGIEGILASKSELDTHGPGNRV
jgi:hypothetical protein